jgi:polysaccharide export outer membrane protein
MKKGIPSRSKPVKLRQSNPLLATAVLILYAAAWLVAGCATTSQDQESNLESIPTNFFEPNTATNIAPGDVLRVNFYFHPELNQLQRVRADGKIALSFFQGLEVAGLTPDELQEKLVELYSRDFVNPVITVTFEEKASRAVFVTGEVAEGGLKPIPTHTTVGQLLTRCKVNHLRAALDKVVLVRRHSDTEYRAYQLNADYLNGAERDLYLKDGDILVVPRNTITSVGDFVQRYIRDVIPPDMNIGFLFTYELSDD